MKYTLLEMVQSIMSDMDSDEITAITDTVESEQVASIIRDVYFQFIANNIIPENRQLFQFASALTASKVFLKIPDTISQVLTFRYNVIESGDTINRYSEIQYKNPEDFLRIVMDYDNTDTTVTTTIDPTSSTVIYVYNDQAPTIWTSFDDKYICVNAYDAAVDASGLVGTKTIGWGTVNPTWTVSGSFVPAMDDNLFPYLLAEAKSTCFVNLKQQANPKIEKQSKDQRIKIQHGKYRTSTTQKASFNPTSPFRGPNYGRRRQG